MNSTMWKVILIWLCLSGYCYAGPVAGKRNMPIIQREEEPSTAAMPNVASMNGENDVNKPEAAAIDEETQNAQPPMTLTLPSNATSIRHDITDGFSCANRSYGYYADVENDCQIFHVCLPVTYADGKENIFRWSFICPEETIFSQDSFTCMRREDMTIECEESFKYYELNRNFGMIDEESTNSNKNMQSNDVTENANEDQETAMTTHEMDEQAQIQAQQSMQPQQIMSEEKEKEKEKPSPSFSPSSSMSSAAMKPHKQKPLKGQKPNRRKPATTAAATTMMQKKKPAMPVRKTPQPTKASQPIALTTTTISNLAAAENSPTEVESESKPSFPSRFTKRPTTLLSSNLKEKFQPIRPQAETTPIRAELYNQKRKRPAFMNKKDKDATTSTTTTKILEDSMPTTELSLSNEATPLNEAEEEETKPEISIKEETKAEIPSKETLENDVVASQASETSEVFIKPEEEQKDSIDGEEPLRKVHSPQPTEPETQLIPESSKVEETPAVVEPPEAIEEIPAVITEVEEVKINEKKEQTKPEQEDENKNKTEEKEEESSKTSEAIEKEKVEEKEKDTTPELLKKVSEEKETSNAANNEPLIFQQNSEENIAPAIASAELTPALEEMEGQKPANAPETMPATLDMEHQDPIIKQILTEKNEAPENMQSMGGFKPVDPLMAAEAEALIADFLHTVLRSDPVSPVMPINHHEETNTAEEIPAAPLEDEEKLEINQQTSEIETPIVEQSLKTDTENLTPIKEENPPSAMPSMIMLMNNHPGEIFQIPVQVIQSPIEELQTKSEAKPQETLEIQNSPEPTIAPSKPLSIDDIVELVKEQLDQVPNPEEAPKIEDKMQVVATPQSEELIEPIYHRVSEKPNPNMITAHQNPELAIPVEEEEPKEDASESMDSKTKIDRALSARALKTASKMDPRKRRFLFRTEVRS